MNGPEQADLVVPAMQPIVKEVFGQEQQEPIREDIRDGDPMMSVAELEDKQIEAAEQEVDRAIQQHQVDIAKGVLERIEFSTPVIAEQDLQADDDYI